MATNPANSLHIDHPACLAAIHHQVQPGDEARLVGEQKGRHGGGSIRMMLFEPVCHQPNRFMPTCEEPFLCLADGAVWSTFTKNVDIIFRATPTTEPPP